jgi:hypothetical protein
MDAVHSPSTQVLGDMQATVNLIAEELAAVLVDAVMSDAPN